MIVTLTFSAKYLNRYLNPQLNYQAIRNAVNVFLSYVLELHRRHEIHDNKKLEEITRKYYVLHCDIRPPEYRGCNYAKIQFNEKVLETILELVEVLEQHYLYDVQGVINELSNNYWIESLAFQRMTRNCLYVVAHCRPVLSPPA